MIPCVMFHDLDHTSYKIVLVMRMLKFTDLTVLDREPAFPIYIAWSYLLDLFPSNYEPGRVINPRPYRDPNTGAIDRSIEEHLGPNDIIFIPLFPGDENDRFVYANVSTKNRLPAYDENTSLIRDIAPRVKAIIVGNAGLELSFKDEWLRLKPTYGSGLDRKWMSEQMCDFMKSTSEIILDAGGTPCYGPVDWDVAIDCYYGDAIYRDLSNEIGALQYCCCGYQLFELQRRDGYPKVPHPSDVRYWPCCPKDENRPWQMLTEYLSGYDHIITGIGHMQGILKGNDGILAEHGFDAGCLAGITPDSVSDYVPGFVGGDE
jgi:hypothetical protein